jgi:hypothetical protein
VANAIYAFGKYDAIGYSPFGIDRSAGAETDLARAYGLLSQVAPLILEHQGKGTITAVLLERDGAPKTVRLGNYDIEARYSARCYGPANANASPDCVPGLLIATGPDDIVIVGRGMNVCFASACNPSESVGLGTVDEGVYGSPSGRYAAAFLGSSQPGKTSTPGWHFNARARTFARSTPRRTRSFSIAEMVACGIPVS